MNRVEPHKHPLTPPGIFCLMLMVILLANPVLTAVSASMDCNGESCCCSRPLQAQVSKISTDAGMPCCCTPHGSKLCHLSSGNKNEAPLALSQSDKRPPIDSIHLLIGTLAALALPEQRNAPISRVDTGPPIHRLPLYLQICHLIC